jgi:hypothetical protein
MVTGSLPYTGMSPQELYANIVSEAILVDPRTLPKGNIEILAKVKLMCDAEEEDF